MLLQQIFHGFSNHSTLTIIQLCKQNLRENCTVADLAVPVNYGYQSSVNGEAIITESYVQSHMLP
jgi:hypothetical protein